MVQKDFLSQGEEGLAHDVMRMLDELAISRNGIKLIPELFAVPEDQVKLVLQIYNNIMWHKSSPMMFSPALV